MFMGEVSLDYVVSWMKEAPETSASFLKVLELMRTLKLPLASTSKLIAAIHLRSYTALEDSGKKNEEKLNAIVRQLESMTAKAVARMLQNCKEIAAFQGPV